MITYKNLGKNGALGNQLWEMAGTIGIAYKKREAFSFPLWDYQPYFSVPGEFFSGIEDKDLGLDYLQELHYWEDIEDTIAKYFQPSEMVLFDLYEKYKDLLGIHDLTAVHVRRANNIYLPDHHPVCSLDYFEQAMDKFKSSDFLVFSDEIEWCKQQPLFSGCFFAEGNDPDIDIMELTNATPLSLATAAYDLHLMSMCKNVIISNSSFGWWGAWLSGSRNVVRPERWYGPALAHINVDAMIPEHWESLDA